MRLLLTAAAALLSFSAAASWQGPVTSEIWALPSPPGVVRWIVIHNLASAQADGMFHIEVLERKAGDPAWKFKHLAKHMAVTEAALRASIVRPRKRGMVYPETYDYSLAQWQRDQDAGRAAVCGSTIAECLEGTTQGDIKNKSGRD